MVEPRDGIDGWSLVEYEWANDVGTCTYEHENGEVCVVRRVHSIVYRH